MADYWIYRRGQFPSLETSQHAFNWAGVMAYVGASAIAYLTGQVGWGIVPINGIVSALGILGDAATKPLVVRLDGNAVDEGRRILAEAAHPLVTVVATMDEAADKAAELASK